MNFALLGDDRAVLHLLRAIARGERHRLGCAALAGSLERELATAFPAIRILPDWDGILTAPNVDAVIVSGAEEHVLEAARQLAAAGKPLIIFPRSGQGSTWIYELGLIRDEGRAALIPAFWDRLRPAIRRLREPSGQNDLGQLLYLKIDREIGPRDESAGPPLLTTDQLDDALLHDADLLRSLGGDYSRVSAVQSGTRGDRMAAASVSLMGERLPEATWTARATSGTPRWTLVVAGDNGEVTVTADPSSDRWTVNTDRVEIPGLEALADLDGGAVLLQALEVTPASPSGPADWADLVRAFEVVDAARTSVRRRRTIDLRLETTSERNIFKSQMTALGCLVLTLTLFGVLFLLIVMPLFDMRSRTQLEAERAGALFHGTEFTMGSAKLNADGTRHLEQLAGHMTGTHFPVVLEGSSEPGSRQLDQRRRAEIVAYLRGEGVTDAADRTQVGPVVGRLYPTALRIVRLLVFAPLALYLILQALLVLARPAAK